ncbi:MAG: hypothetical protein ACT4NV_08760 [Rhodoferax sp.]
MLPDPSVLAPVAARPFAAGWGRRALLAAGLALALPALGQAQGKTSDNAQGKAQAQAGRARGAPPEQGSGTAAQRWWVELRLARDEAAVPAEAAHYRSDASPAAPWLQLQLAQGERGRFALEQAQPWVWTDAVWAPAAPAAAASAPAAPASSPTAGGVLQSLQWRRQTQVLECELLAPAPQRAAAAPGAAAVVGLRVRLLWSGAAAAAAEVLDAPQGSERVELEAELSVPVQQWVLLARSGASFEGADAASEAGSGTRHYRAGSERAVAPTARALYLRVRPVQP